MHRFSVSGKFMPVLTVLTFVVAGFLLYGQTIAHDFVALDDDIVIFNNPVVQEMTPGSIAQAFTTYDPELYVPFTMISLQVSWLMGGGEPWAFHLGNVLLHIGNALLVAWLLSLLLKRQWMGIAAGMIYLIHPLNVEAVAWASARKDVLSAFFGLGSCIAHVYGMRGWKPGRRVGLELFLCALLSKVSVIILPVWLILFEWIEHGRITRAMLRRQWPYFALAAVFAVIAVIGKPHGVSGLPLYAYFAIGAKAVVHYLMQFFIPANLSVTYEFTGPLTTLRLDILLSIAACVVLCIAAWMARKHLSLFSAGIAIFAVTLVPSFFNVTKGRAIYFASDRYVYLALVGLLLALATLLTGLLRRFPATVRLTAVVIAMITASWAVTASRAAGVWHDTIRLFEHARSVSPDSAIMLNNLGNGYIAAGRPSDAEALYRDALERHPGWGTLRMNLANALELQGKTDEAVALLQDVIATDGDSRAEAFYRLGNMYAALGRKDDALAAFEMSLQIDPRFVMSRFGDAQNLAKP